MGARDDLHHALELPKQVTAWCQHAERTIVERHETRMVSGNLDHGALAGGQNPLDVHRRAQLDDTVLDIEELDVKLGAERPTPVLAWHQVVHETAVCEQ